MENSASLNMEKKNHAGQNQDTAINYIIWWLACQPCFRLLLGQVNFLYRAGLFSLGARARYYNLLQKHTYFSTFLRGCLTYRFLQKDSMLPILKNRI